MSNLAFVNVLPPGWEVPDALPGGVTVAPAADPVTAARVIAERVGGELVVDVSAAERALAREASRRRAERVVADAAEAARLVALLEGTDMPADGDEVRLAAARLRTAEVTAAAAARMLGGRPSVTSAEVELMRARSLAAAVHDAASGTDGPRGGLAGVLAMALGTGLLLVGSGAPALAGACVPCIATGGLVEGRRRRRRASSALRAEADAAAAAVERAHAAWSRAADAEREWQARARAASEADAELDAARHAWTALVGDVDVADAEALVDAAAARDREAARARLHEVLHGRRIDRLRAEAEAARELLATPAPSALVLCDPFALIGRGRRRALLDDLERVPPDVTLAVVTADSEAVAWAAAKARTKAVAVP